MSPSTSLNSSVSILSYLFLSFTVRTGRFDFEEKYPLDPIYEEMGPNARVWRVNLDECEVYDNDMVTEARDGLDLLLVFVRLQLTPSTCSYKLPRLVSSLPSLPLSSRKHPNRSPTTLSPFLHLC